MSKLTIFINGDPSEVEPGTTLEQYLKTLNKVAQKGQVLAYNNTIVRETFWSECVLNDGDQISIFEVIAGG